jgi:hypothetical protein
MLMKDAREAIQASAALLFCVVCEAEGNGASSEVIQRHLAEEVGAMEEALSELYPPESVRAIVDELLDAYQAYGAPL